MSGTEEPLRVLIADDDESTRLTLTATLNNEPTVALVGCATDTDDAIKLATELVPDVVVLDWMMPGGGGAKAASEIHRREPSIRIVALTGMDPLHASRDMMSAGAVGFLEKGCSGETLVDAIHSARRY